MGQRLQRLSSECRRILQLAAVAGRDFDLAVLDHILRVLLRYKGNGEWSYRIEGRAATTLMFSGTKAELLESLSR